MKKELCLSSRGLIAIIALFMLLLACFIFVLTEYVGYKKFNPFINRPPAENCNRHELIAHLPLNSVSGGAIIDEASETNASLSSLFNIKYLTEFFLGPLGTVKGMVGNALSFDGDQWIKLGNKSCFNIQEFTATVWILQRDEEVHIPTIMAKSSWPAYDGWWLYTDDNRELGLGIAWGNGYTHVESDYILPLNEWHHVAITVSNKKNEVQFFVDGEPYGDKHKNVPNWLNNWNHELIVGGYDGSGNWPWHGSLDEVRFYSKELSPEEINEIYKIR